MGRKLIDVVEYLDMVDEVYQEEDGTYFHNIYYKEDDPKPWSEKRIRSAIDAGLIPQ